MLVYRPSIEFFGNSLFVQFGVCQKSGAFHEPVKELIWSKSHSLRRCQLPEEGIISWCNVNKDSVVTPMDSLRPVLMHPNNVCRNGHKSTTMRRKLQLCCPCSKGTTRSLKTPCMVFPIVELIKLHDGWMRQTSFEPTKCVIRSASWKAFSKVAQLCTSGRSISIARESRQLANSFGMFLIGTKVAGIPSTTEHTRVFEVV